MYSLFSFLGGLFLGWSVGTNDSANMFGTAVASRMVKYRTAVILIAVSVVVGAFLQGSAGTKTVSSLAAENATILVTCTFAAALTMTLMSYLRIPVSSSQMMIGAVIGVGVVRGNAEWAPIAKVLSCWILNPFGAMLIAAIVYRVFAWPIRRFRPSVYNLDPLLRAGLIICGCYGAYALGANGVGIVSVVFQGQIQSFLGQHWPDLTGHAPKIAAAVGGLFIGFGAITYSKPVMMTVGKGIVPLDAFTAFVAVLSLAITVHIFAIIGVPVSTSQSIIGGLLGIGMIKGLHVVNQRMLKRVVIWWIVSPFISAAVSIILYYAFVEKRL